MTAATSTVASDSRCIYRSTNRYLFDYTNLDRSGDDHRTNYAVDGTRYEIDFNVCHNTIKICGVEQSMAIMYPKFNENYQNNCNLLQTKEVLK
jgi:hypothetical protein